MRIDKLKEEFDHVKKKFSVVRKDQEIVYIPRKDYDFFVDALDYLLDQQMKDKDKKKAKEKEPSE